MQTEVWVRRHGCNRPEADITRISTYRALMTDNRHSRDNVATWVELVARLQSTRLWN